jgi:hypothetical protein
MRNNILGVSRRVHPKQASLYEVSEHLIPRTFEQLNELFDVRDDKTSTIVEVSDETERVT